MQKNKLVLGALILIPLILASFPGIPHQFYGGVIVNEKVMQTGTVTAKINNQTIATTQIHSGKYGYNPIFYVEDKNYNFNGKTIFFYVNGFSAGSYVFENGASTRLDLIVGNYVGYCGDSVLDSKEQCDDGDSNGVKCDNSKSSCNYCSNSCKIIKLGKEGSSRHTSGGSSGETRVLSACTPNWQCSNWGECVDGVQLRNCDDKNYCGTELDKPSETRICETTLPKVILSGKENIDISPWLIVLLGLLVVGILVIVVNMIR